MSEKRLASNQRRSLETMRGKLLLMAEQWDEVDYCVMSELERLADSFATVVSELTFVIEKKTCKGLKTTLITDKEKQR